MVLPRQRGARLRTIQTILLAGLMGGLVPTVAQASPQSDVLRLRGFELAYNLEHDDAMALLREAVQTDPADPATHRSLAAVTWLHILFTRGAVTVDLYLDKLQSFRPGDEAPPLELAQSFYRHIDRAIELAERRLETAPDDPNAHYELGVAVGLRASYLATVEGSKLAGFRAARRAFDAHERVLALDPSRKDAGLIVGTYRYIVANLPFALRWFAYMVGFGGGQERGIQMVEEAAVYPSDTQTDARFALILLYNREERYDDAIRVIGELQEAYPRNRLIWLESGSTALRAGRSGQAEATLSDGLRMLAGDPRRRIPGEEALWRYKRGAARIELGRVPEARQDLQAAMAVDAPPWIRGRLHVELGKLSDLDGDRSAARAQYEQAIQLCREADDPTCEAEGKRLRRRPYRPPRGAGAAAARSGVAEIQGDDVPAIPHVEPGADERGRRPGVLRQQLRPRVDVQPVGCGGRQGEIPILVDDDQPAVGVDHLGPGERSFPPGLLPGLDVDGRQERRPEVASGHEDHTPDADGVAEVQAQAVAEPELLHRGCAAGAREVEDATAAVVRRRAEQQVALAPHGSTDVQTVVGLVRVAPQEATVGGVESHDLPRREHDQLVLTIDLDEHRRGRCQAEVLILPRHVPAVPIEGNHRLAGPAHRQDDVVAVGDRARRVAAVARHAELLLEIVEPGDLA